MVLVAALSVSFTHQARAEPPNPCFDFDLCDE
jgi:hypothetical protein